MLAYDRYNGLPIDEPNSYYLYVFRRESDGYTKIGITDNPRRRVREIAVNCGSHLRPVSICNVGNELLTRFAEKTLHDAYKSLNKWTLGEWFNMPIVSLIDIQLLVTSIIVTQAVKNPELADTHLFREWCNFPIGFFWMEQFDGNRENAKQIIRESLTLHWLKSDSIVARFLVNCFQDKEFSENEIKVTMEVLMEQVR